MEADAILGEQVYMAVTWKGGRGTVLGRQPRAGVRARGGRIGSPCCMQFQGRVY